MSALNQTMRTIRGAVILSMLLAVSATAQQASPAQATVPATAPAPVPAPAASPLFERTDDHAPTIAAAVADDAAAMQGENHTIVISTLVLVLAIVILVLLIT